MFSCQSLGDTIWKQFLPPKKFLSFIPSQIERIILVPLRNLMGWSLISVCVTVCVTVCYVCDWLLVHGTTFKVGQKLVVFSYLKPVKQQLMYCSLLAS